MLTQNHAGYHEAGNHEVNIKSNPSAGYRQSGMNRHNHQEPNGPEALNVEPEIVILSPFDGLSFAFQVNHI